MGLSLQNRALPIFTKVLIANRGEIACRIIRTLKLMGIGSVAVFSEVDRGSLHVAQADEAVLIGPAPASESYLSIEKIIAAALTTGAQAIHPGYGFLSENPHFARACQAAGLVFIGPRPEHMEAFGLKHRARQAALAATVPLLPGTGLLASLEAALEAAADLGWPLILKSTGGGGGIGMQVCHSPQALREAWASTASLAQRNFKDAGLYIERYVEQARHIEVQIFGDGRGGLAVLGDRDCSVQRRNQKVIEETPAPGLSPRLRQQLHAAARSLGASQNYASAGTVEFVLDAVSQNFYFLEVNTRLQVEHTVTEEVFRIDLVDWMIRQAAGLWSIDEAAGLEPAGYAIQARLYAEDPWRSFQPAAGLITGVEFESDLRLETWISPGLQVGTDYDPLLAKLIASGPSREAAITKLRQALQAGRIGGLTTNRCYLAAILESPSFKAGRCTTQFLASFRYSEQAVEVLNPGTQTTVQDWPGRLGYWQVGIPPSGPMDSLSFRLANRLLNNPESAAGLECTFIGPTLFFRDRTQICLTGADMGARLNGQPVPMGRPITVEAAQTLELGKLSGPGQRCYMAIAGGFDVPAYLASRSTFTLGGFGGHGGRALLSGDLLPFDDNPSSQAPVGRQASATAHQAFPLFTPDWDPQQLRVLVGPQGAPEHFKASDLQRFVDSDWEVHFNSSRTGVRLIGPSPDWPRPDGGDAGLHPSNIHDNPYSIGAMDFTGDMPVLLGPDGPSLGGFVCPFTVIAADLWKLGQLAAGMRVRFFPVTLELARAALDHQETVLQTFPTRGQAPALVFAGQLSNTETVLKVSPVIESWLDPEGRQVQVRRSGDQAVLLELGADQLDLGSRLIIQWWLTATTTLNLPGIIDLTPGIRSLHVHFDDRVCPSEQLISQLKSLSHQTPALADLTIPNRTIWLPLSWDDPATQLAIQKYTATVRPDAPWCPSNIEFIRRINGLSSIAEVYDVVFAASYLVLGLGDVYLGAPVATPEDPRHRLITTKYNPARTWTPENAVGIGGAYLCVYGMEGPGGYQFVGRTIQMWNRFKTPMGFEKPWLLRFFDRLRFFPVSADELLQIREDFPLGRYQLRIETGEFSFKSYQGFLEANQSAIDQFRGGQQAAFHQERQRWKAAGLDSFKSELPPIPEVHEALPPGAEAIATTVSGRLWKLTVKPGQTVSQGQEVAILESMKMEIQICAPYDGEIVHIYRQEGDSVINGQSLVAIRR